MEFADSFMAVMPSNRLAEICPAKTRTPFVPQSMQLMISEMLFGVVVLNSSVGSCELRSTAKLLSRFASKNRLSIFDYGPMKSPKSRSYV